MARHATHTIHVMHTGRIAESGTPDAIFNNPQHEVTRTFLA
jgi:peptide/nickel transport system ATP-binding protein